MIQEDIKIFDLGSFEDKFEMSNIVIYATKIKEKVFIDWFYDDENKWDIYTEIIRQRLEQIEKKQYSFEEVEKILRKCEKEEIPIPFEENIFLELFFNDKEHIRKATKKYLKKYLLGEEINKEIKKVIDKEIKKMEEEENKNKKLIEKITKIFGNEIVLNTIENQYGEKIYENWIEIKNGKIFNYQINCYSSSDLGLGNCQCVSHDPIYEEEINALTLLYLIKDYEKYLKHIANEYKHLNYEEIIKELKQDEKIYKPLIQTLKKIKKEAEKIKKREKKEKEILNKLKKLGLKNEIVLNTRENQYGQEIKDKWIEVDFENGKIYYAEINCLSSSLLNLGTCQCVSHKPITKKEIDIMDLYFFMEKYGFESFFYSPDNINKRELKKIIKRKNEKKNENNIILEL